MTAVLDRRPRSSPSAVRAGRRGEARRVLITYPLSAERTAALRSRLGPACRLVDVHGAEPADVVVCPPCSTATVARLRKDYPAAAIVVVEPDGAGGGDQIDAPVSRLLSAGACAYQLDASPDALAAAIAEAFEGHHRPPPVGQRAG